MSDGYDDQEQQGSNEMELVKPSALARSQANELAAQAVGARVQALVQAKFVMAAKMPRSLDVVRTAMKKRCQDPQFAAKARYCVERGNKKDPQTGQWVTNYIEGPSIRFVEEMTRHFGNIELSTTTLYDDEDKRVIRGEAIDYESNSSWSKEITVTKTVERSKPKGEVLGRRTNSYGKAVYILRATDADFEPKEGSAISKALRTLALRLLPGDIVAEMERLIIKTQETEDAKNPDAARLAVIDGFANLGITPEQLAEFLGHPTDTMSAEEIKRLRGFGVALAEGAITWRDLMDARGGGDDADADPEKVAARAAKEEELKKKVSETIEKKKAQAAAKEAAKKGATGAKAPDPPPTPKPEPKPADAPAAAKQDPTTHDGQEPPADWKPGGGA